MPHNPYQTLPASAFWRTAVADCGALPDASYSAPKWPLRTTDRIATAGSCFAQHIGRRLRREGYVVLDKEPAPKLLPRDRHLEHGYGMFSARYGNIYTVRQMRELVEEAFGLRPLSQSAWAKGSGFVDALRPTVDPQGHATPKAVVAHRRYHLECLRKLFLEAEVFIFTLGLTETWEELPSGRVLPVCPGTVAGTFDPGVHRFRNLTFEETWQDLVSLRDTLHNQRSGQRLRMLLTVSPVPLTATASGKHVMLATVYSKSILRAVAGQMADAFEDVDYFPSYEIVSNPYSDNTCFAGNKRSVLESSVELVMSTFMSIYSSEKSPASPLRQREQASDLRRTDEEADLIMTSKCDDELLDAFGPAKT
jgi:hypothetical protein